MSGKHQRWGLCVALLLALWQGMVVTTYAQESELKPGVDLILLIDHSLSIHGSSGLGIAGIDPQGRRLIVAQSLIDMLAEDGLRSEHSHRVAVIAFGVQQEVQLALQTIDPYYAPRVPGHAPISGTDYASALRLASEQLDDRPDRQRLIVMLTDGYPGGAFYPATDAPTRIRVMTQDGTIAATLSILKKRGARVMLGVVPDPTLAGTEGQLEAAWRDMGISAYGPFDEPWLSEELLAMVQALPISPKVLATLTPAPPAIPTPSATARPTAKLEIPTIAPSVIAVQTSWPTFTATPGLPPPRRNVALARLAQVSANWLWRHRWLMWVLPAIVLTLVLGRVFRGRSVVRSMASNDSLNKRATHRMRWQRWFDRRAMDLEKTLLNSGGRDEKFQRRLRVCFERLLLTVCPKRLARIACNPYLNETYNWLREELLREVIARR